MRPPTPSRRGGHELVGIGVLKRWYAQVVGVMTKQAVGAEGLPGQVDHQVGDAAARAAILGLFALEDHKVIAIEAGAGRADQFDVFAVGLIDRGVGDVGEHLVDQRVVVANGERGGIGSSR